MPMTKTEWRQRWREIQDIFLAWDPIGMMSYPDWPRDEYDAYVGPTLRLLERGASLDDLQAYLADVELNQIGLSETPSANRVRRDVAVKLQAWYQSSWPNSSV